MLHLVLRREWKSRWIFFAAMVFAPGQAASPSAVWATEFSQQLSVGDRSLADVGESAVSAFGRRYQTFVAEERVAREAVKGAARLAVSTTDPSWKNYRRVEYVGRRARHVATYVVYIVGTLRDKERLDWSLSEARQQLRELSASPTLRGLRQLVVLVMDLAERDARTTNIEEIGARAVRDANLSIIANLTAEPSDFGQLQRRLMAVDERCLGGLRVLKGELAYLEQRLDEIQER